MEFDDRIAPIGLAIPRAIAGSHKYVAANRVDHGAGAAPDGRQLRIAELRLPGEVCRCTVNHLRSRGSSCVKVPKTASSPSISELPFTRRRMQAMSDFSCSPDLRNGGKVTAYRFLCRRLWTSGELTTYLHALTALRLRRHSVAQTDAKVGTRFTGGPGSAIRKAAYVAGGSYTIPLLVVVFIPRYGQSAMDDSLAHRALSASEPGVFRQLHPYLPTFRRHGFYRLSAAIRLTAHCTSRLFGNSQEAGAPLVFRSTRRYDSGLTFFGVKSAE